MTAVTISMLRSLWRSVFLIYQGAFTMSLSTLFWKVFKLKCGRESRDTLFLFPPKIKGTDDDWVNEWAVDTALLVAWNMTDLNIFCTMCWWIITHLSCFHCKLYWVSVFSASSQIPSPVVVHTSCSNNLLFSHFKIEQCLSKWRRATASVGHICWLIDSQGKPLGILGFVFLTDTWLCFQFPRLYKHFPPKG